MFTSHLGSVEKYPTDAAIKSIANHVRKLQEELEYRLAHLDSTNISEIDADETTITGGIVSLVSQSVGEIAALKLTGEQMAATVEGLGERVSSLVLTADSLTATVQNLNASVSQTVRLAADGLTITNAAGSALTIDGGQINADTLNLTGRITFADLDAATQAAITKDNTKEYLASIGITEITGGSVKAPLIEGGEIRGAEIYGGFFADIEADNYLKMQTTESSGGSYVNHSLSHYVGDASEGSGVPLTSIGWAAAMSGNTLESMWYLAILGSIVLERRRNTLFGDHMKANGVWDFSGCTVNFTGANVIGI